MRLLSTGLMTALIAVPAALPAGAQSCPSPAAAADSAAAHPSRPPDVLIVASAAIAQLRFESDPRLQARTTGCPGPQSVVTTQRQSLPHPVQPGATYQDVRVGVEVRAWVNVECLPAMAAADPALCAPVQLQTRATPPAGQPAPANPPRR